MRKSRAALAAGAIGIAAAAGIFIASASASVSAPAQNTTGEAGYYVNDWNNWHIRDAHAQFTVTPAMRTLPSTSATVNEAVGGELCDPNTGDSAQAGLLWESTTGFEVGAQYGTLSSAPGAQDPCIQDGVLSPSPEHVLLGGTTGNKVSVGDVISVDVYYSTTAAHGRHAIQYTACDVTTNVCRQAFDYVRAQNFFEAGIGVLNQGAPSLTAPALNPLVRFSDATFSNYNGSAKAKLANGGWQLDEAETVNGASQVTLQPSAVSGVTFSVAEGSASS
jgi:hypothetical protein